MTAPELIATLQSKANPANVVGMARFGISSNGTLGVSVAEIRKLARLAGRNHDLALDLWGSGIHEARILATIVDEPARVGRRQMNAWARDFDSWDVCDQACMNLFHRTRHAWDMAQRWAAAKPEFVRRAGFAQMACLAAKDKTAADECFHALLPLIIEGASDERNYVKKAVSWALRGIGKRNSRLRKLAIETSREIGARDSRSARWIAVDALRELRS